MKETTCQASPIMGAKSVLYDFSGCKSQFGFGKAPAKRSHLHCTHTHTTIVLSLRAQACATSFHWHPLALKSHGQATSTFVIPRACSFGHIGKSHEVAMCLSTLAKRSEAGAAFATKAAVEHRRGMWS